tara:strand:+ start:4982 stop:6232 length:1251 start_codon:yes stop_codon:yes gene_type:complete
MGNCQPNNQEYTVSTTSGQMTSAPSRPLVKIYLETSLSMKGYADANVPGDYTFKEVIPFLITDIDNRIGESKLFTVADAPEIYTRSKDDFYTSLRNGQLFKNRSSKLHHIFNNVIDSLRPQEAAIIISDCILDLGNADLNFTERGMIVHSIYNRLTQSKIAAAVFQYYSDFNGAYYYDRQNTGSRIASARPFYGDVMKKRPFYVWVLGDVAVIKKMLREDVFRDYENTELFGLEFNDDIKVQLLSHPRKGKVIVAPEKSRFVVIENSQSRPAQISLGLNLSVLPATLATPSFLQSHFQFNQSHIDGEVGVINKEDIDTEKEYTEVRPVMSREKLTHLLSLSFTNLSETSGDFQLQLHKPEARWTRQAHLDDDVEISLASLEGKTYAFQSLMEAFYKAYDESPTLLTINFKETINQP